MHEEDGANSGRNNPQCLDVNPIQATYRLAMFGLRKKGYHT
jgi:hypothetical protein